MLQELATNADYGLGALSGMVEAISPVEKMSRDLRPALRKLRQGLTVMMEGREVTNEWARLVESSPLRCDDDSEPPGSD